MLAILNITTPIYIIIGLFQRSDMQVLALRQGQEGLAAALLVTTVLSFFTISALLWLLTGVRLRQNRFALDFVLG